MTRLRHSPIRRNISPLRLQPRIRDDPVSEVDEEDELDLDFVLVLEDRKNPVLLASTVDLDRLRQTNTFSCGSCNNL